MWKAWIFLVLACLCFTMGAWSCTLPSPETVGKLTELKSQTQVLGTELVDAVQFVADVKSDIAHVIEQGKAGGLSAEKVSELLSELYARLDEGNKRVASIKEAIASTNAKIKELQESGVPWWQIAIWIALGAFNVATGKGYLKERGGNKIANYAVSGINSIVKYIEDVYVKGGTVKDVKVKIAKMNHAIVEDAVEHLPPSPVVVSPPPTEEPPPKEKKIS